MVEQIQDPKDNIVDRPNPYSNPSLLSAGKNQDGRPTFYMVVDKDGLGKLAKDGLFTEQQADRIRKEFIKEEKNDKGEPKDANPNQRFIIEVQKNTEDETKLKRIIDAQYIPGRYSGGNWVVGSPAGYFTMGKDYYPPAIALRASLSLTQPGLPVQGMSGEMSVRAENKEGVKFPNQEDAKSFLQNFDKVREKFVKTDSPDSSMQDALAKAADGNYQPATPEGYESPATVGSITQLKTGKSAA